MTRRLIASAFSLALLLAVAPAGSTVADARNMTHVANVNFDAGSHLEFLTRADENGTRVYALAGFMNDRSETNGGVKIIDVTDPESPVLTASVTCPAHNSDPGVSPDGRYVVMTLDGSDTCRVTGNPAGFRTTARDIAIIDVRDVAAPVLMGTPTSFASMGGVHTIQFHPTENIAYLSTQNTPESTSGSTRIPRLYILDLRGAAPAISSVDMPQVGSSPHDITFNAAGTRAYVSAVTASYILDTTSPLAPSLVSLIVDPTINIHHESIPVPGGRYLMITDEVGGAAVSPQCPGGGVHVYDISDDTRPEPVGTFFATDIRTAPTPAAPGGLPVCTAHEGSFNADATRFAIGWYQGGARVFDTSALVTGNPPRGTLVGLEVTEVGHARQEPASDVWAAKMHPLLPGYVFATENMRGFDVYRLSGDAL